MVRAHGNSREVFSRLASAHLTARPSKCVIGSKSIDFIGHFIGQGGVEPNEKTSVKIQQAPRPTTKKELRSFIGLTGFYRDYIPEFGAV